MTETLSHHTPDPVAFAMYEGGIRLRIRLTPGSSADRIEDIVALADGGEVITARTRAIPEAGKANLALEKLVAQAFSVPRRDVRIASGHKARIKQVEIAGDPAPLLDTARRLWPSALNIGGPS